MNQLTLTKEDEDDIKTWLEENSDPNQKNKDFMIDEDYRIELRAAIEQPNISENKKLLYATLIEENTRPGCHNIPKNFLKEIKEIIDATQTKKLTKYLENKKLEAEKKEIIPTLKNSDLKKEIIIELDKEIIGEKNLKRYLINFCAKKWVKNLSDHCGALINDKSSKGKSYCTTKIIDVFPDSKGLTKITPESLSYWHEGEKGFSYDGTILYFEDIRKNVLESETLKTFITDKTTCLITRNQEAIEINVKGKPVIIITSCNASFGEEMLNRLEICRLTKDAEQTNNILRYQLEKSMGRTEEINTSIIKKLQCLEIVQVHLELIEDDLLKIETQYNNEKGDNLRRDFPRFLDKIKANAALNQYRRPRKGEIVLAEKEDLVEAINIINTMYQETTSAKLTYNEERILETIKEWVVENPIKYSLEITELNPDDTKGWFTRSDIHAANPFVTFKVIGEYIDSLVTKGILKSVPLKLGDNKKPSFMYRLINEGLKKFKLTI
ncbi:MAG: hypothetical protein KKF89_00795 [Nanoarchaeota archaeon]|nr:hypothetical protein [Nanoarchaeota archaeon]MBU1854234.1 hypothetical protein [Nanoarchaeota archaeon]